MKFSRGFSQIAFYYGDRFIDKLCLGIAKLMLFLTEGVRRAHNGLLPLYLSWVLGGFVILLLLLVIIS